MRSIAPVFFLAILIVAFGAVHVGYAQCVDVDGDGYGDGPDCIDVDCDDNASSCTTDCTTDIDGDGVPDCRDLCIDADGDEYGADNSTVVIGPGNETVGQCTSDGVSPCLFEDGSCIDRDCDDADPLIGVECGPVAGKEQSWGVVKARF